MNTPILNLASSSWPLLLPLLGSAGLAAAAAGAVLGPRDAAWRRAEWAALGAFALAAVALALVLAAGPQLGYGLRLDAAGAAVATLVGFIAWVIVRFSRRYLDGEAGERDYLRLLASTLAAVTLVLAADHLLLLAAAWMACSLSLHGLLRFYAERPAAQLAARKKAISARLADLCLLAATGLLYVAFDSLSLQTILERAAAAPGPEPLPPAAQAAMVLLVLTALLKCAQMPLHGWLIQVMEAPTPVSALLHAGVVNLGGMVLIRFAPLLAQAPLALALLAGVATLTVVAAALVQGTRISIKVALAWSTLAQMGFMLLQIALGLPAMALLHLLAHSLYKAHAFLAAGGVVQRQQALRLAPSAAAPTKARVLLAAAVLPPAVVMSGLAAGALHGPSAMLAGAVLGLALVPLAAVGRWLAAAGVALAWFAGHALTAPLLPLPQFAVPLPLVLTVGALLGLLFGLQAMLWLAPKARLVRSLYPWAYGGFFVDDIVSRWMLPTVPPSLAASPASSVPAASSASTAALPAPASTVTSATGAQA